MHETPGARQPWPDAAPPWDAWERPPAREDPPGGQAPWPPADPAAGYPQAGNPPAAYPPPQQPPPASYPPAPERRFPAQHRLAAARAGERSRWHWLLLVAVLIPLLTPLYNRVQPQLLGLPFFYWGQIAFTGLAMLVTAIIHLATKRRRP